MAADVTSSLHATVASRVAEQLRTEIRAGELAPGAPLRQNDVAARLGVSSTPVREAFQMLERAGLVQREGRRGVRVFSPTLEDLICSYEIRAALEPLAVRRAASRITESALAQLRDLMAEMSGPAVAHEHFMGLNAVFHNLIADASGSPRLAQLIAAEQASTASYVVFLGVDPRSSTQANVEHARIVDALADRDAEAAALAMQEHLSVRGSALEARLERTSPTAV